MQREEPVRVGTIMPQIEAAVRDELRRRLVSRGGPPEFRDAEIFECVHDVLARAADRRGTDVLLVPELLPDDEAWKPAVELRLSSHRSVIGPALVFLERRLLLPAVRGPFEYTEGKFCGPDD